MLDISVKSAIIRTLKVLNQRFYEKKWCQKCGEKLQKWGENRDGSQRYFCKNCQSTKTRKRQDLTKINRKKIFVEWLLSKQTKADFAQEYGVNRRTLSRWFEYFWDKEPQPKVVDTSKKVLVIDGKYVEKFATVLVAATPSELVSWHFTQGENFNSWLTFLNTLSHIPKAIVCDGQKGMLKAIRQRFPRVIIQRCQFHVAKYCLSRLTQNPEYKAAQEFRKLVLRISKVKTKEALRVWLSDYKSWWLTYQNLIKEKTYSTIEFTPTGRRRWHYTHGRLHAAHSHLKNAIPNLFMHLLDPLIPNTTNFVEGAINSTLQEKLRLHRGLNLPKRRILIAHYLRSLQ